MDHNSLRVVANGVYANGTFYSEEVPCTLFNWNYTNESGIAAYLVPCMPAQNEMKVYLYYNLESNMTAPTFSGSGAGSGLPDEAEQTEVLAYTDDPDDIPVLNQALGRDPTINTTWVPGLSDFFSKLSTGYEAAYLIDVDSPLNSTQVTALKNYVQNGGNLIADEMVVASTDEADGVLGDHSGPDYQLEQLLGIKINTNVASPYYNHDPEFRVLEVKMDSSEYYQNGDKVYLNPDPNWNNSGFAFVKLNGGGKVAEFPDDPQGVSNPPAIVGNIPYTNGGSTIFFAMDMTALADNGTVWLTTVPAFAEEIESYHNVNNRNKILDYPDGSHAKLKNKDSSISCIRVDMGMNSTGNLTLGGLIPGSKTDPMKVVFYDYEGAVSTYYFNVTSNTDLTIPGPTNYRYVKLSYQSTGKNYLKVDYIRANSTASPYRHIIRFLNGAVRALTDTPQVLYSGISTTVGAAMVNTTLTINGTAVNLGKGSPLSMNSTNTIDGRAQGTIYNLTVNVTLPSGVEYVPGSASDNGEYNASTRNLTWHTTLNDTLSGDNDFDFSFDVNITSTGQHTLTLNATGRDDVFYDLSLTGSGGDHLLYSEDSLTILGFDNTSLTGTVCPMEYLFINVSTEKANYMPGDQVNITGALVFYQNGSSVAHIPYCMANGTVSSVHLTIRYPNGTVAWEGTVNISTDGNYTANWTLPDDAPTGYYNVTADASWFDYNHDSAAWGIIDHGNATHEVIAYTEFFVGIPEFQDILVPVVGLLGVVVFLRRRRQRKNQPAA